MRARDWFEMSALSAVTFAPAFLMYSPDVAVALMLTGVVAAPFLLVGLTKLR